MGGGSVSIGTLKTLPSVLAFARVLESSCALGEEAQKRRSARELSTAIGREVGFDMVSLSELKKLFA